MNRFSLISPGTFLTQPMILIFDSLYLVWIRSLEKGFLDSLDVEIVSARIVLILSNCMVCGWLYTVKFESDKLLASLAVVIFNPEPSQTLETTRERELFITIKYYRESFL